MDHSFYTADVFTRKPFHGAQIAVFPAAAGLDKTGMLLLARELNLAGTVFVSPPTHASRTRRIHTFTPDGEIDFGSHAIIATAHVLASIGEIELTHQHTRIVLEQNAGPVQVYITREQGRPVFTQFTLRSCARIDRFVPSYRELAEILSLHTSDLEMRTYMPLIVSCGYPYLIVPLRSYTAVRQARFNFSAWGESSAPSSLVQEILLFSTHTLIEASDFHARLVGPRIGVTEDPPIGSCMPAFAHYFCAQPQFKKGTYTYTLDRGEPTTRQSVLGVEMDHKGTEELTTRVGGPAVMVSEGRIRVPAPE